MKDEPQQNNVEVRLGLRKSRSSLQVKSALIQYDMSDDDNLATKWSLKITV